MNSITNERDKGPRTMTQLINRLIEDDLFENGPVKAFSRLQDESVRMAIVHGENATGKSLILRNLPKIVGDYDRSGVETFSVSMKMRTSGDLGGSIMYPSERRRSTGVSSVLAVQGTFRNAFDRPHPVWIILDEPDVGLSDRYAAALGAFIASQVNQMSANIRGVLLVSHSRNLLRRLLSDLENPPHEIAMGENQTLQNYLNRPFEEEACIEDLEDLIVRGRETFRFVSQHDEARKAALKVCSD